MAWIIIASLGRAATLKTLIEYLRRSHGRVRLTSLLALNALRAVTFLAAAVGIVGALLAARAASSSADPSPGSALLIFWMLIMLVGLACSLLNWYLSLAAIFVVKDGASTFAALAAAIDLCRSRTGSIAAALTWFGVAHTAVFVVASSAAAVPLGFSEVLPGGVVLGGLLLVALLYFAAVDFLYVGRLAAYVFMIEEPTALPLPASDDDILSDIPGLSSRSGTENRNRELMATCPDDHIRFADQSSLAIPCSEDNVLRATGFPFTRSPQSEKLVRGNPIHRRPRFGAQYSQLIARRIREQNVFSVVLPCTATLEEIRSYSPVGIILSGGPSSVYDADAPPADPRVLQLGLPVLGICYGLQFMVHALGGKVRAADKREYGHADVADPERLAAFSKASPQDSPSGCRMATKR